MGLSDPDAQLVARTFHERIPEAERPPLGDWLSTIKADPSKAPKALTPYLGAPAPGSAPAANPATPAPAAGGVRVAGAPVLPRSQESHASAGAPVTKEVIATAYRNAVRSGDWTQYDALQSAVLAEHDR